MTSGSGTGNGASPGEHSPTSNEQGSNMDDKRKTNAELGAIMLNEAGPAACQSGYGTTDPEWVGWYALDFGDICRDGTLN